MATFRYTTTAAEDVGLDYTVDLANAARDPKTPLHTATSYLQERMKEILASYLKAQRAVQEADVATAFSKASAADQAAVKAMLKV